MSKKVINQALDDLAATIDDYITGVSTTIVAQMDEEQARRKAADTLIMQKIAELRSGLLKEVGGHTDADSEEQ